MTTERFDVLIVGAGLSGVGAGYRLQTKCPGKSYVILEGRSTMGGTGTSSVTPASGLTRTCSRLATR